MRLAQFIAASSTQIIAEWEQFARSCLPAANSMDLVQRRDHVAEMLKTIVLDLDTPQSKRDQHEKSKGGDDAHVDASTAANSHGTDRAATGYTPVQMVSEFRALRASVLRLWSEAQNEFDRENLEDVTRFNEAIDQLLTESITKYAQDVDRSKDLFLGVLGHDLRNPLGAIMMSATVMVTNEGPDWPHLETASRILTSCTRMDGMIGDLLDFTRTRLGGGIPVVAAEMDLETVCRQTVDEVAASHPGSPVRVDARGDLRGRWDRGRIGQAMSNLVGNARQHGREGAPIEVVLRGEPDHVTVTVHNDGVAIPKDRLEGIFDPFRQGDHDRETSRDLASLGLGLYIVEAIVLAHGGTIDVESATQHGTTFTMRLPRDLPSPVTP